MKINHMLVSTIPLIFVNNATRSYTTYMYHVITECRISDLMYVSRGQRKASSAAKLSDICSYFWHRVLLQNLPNKIISILLDKKLCYTICLYFYFFFSYFCPPAFSESGKCLFWSVPLFVHPTASPSIFGRYLWVSAFNSYLDTIWPKEDPSLCWGQRSR